MRIIFILMLVDGPISYLNFLKQNEIYMSKYLIYIFSNQIKIMNAWKKKDNVIW